LQAKFHIQDKEGEQYLIHLDDNGTAPIFRLKLSNPQVQDHIIGYANCFMAGDSMLLQDILINESVTLISRQTGWFSLFNSVKREERHFRNLGLGTALLKAVIEFAKKKGVKKVSGKIVDKDYKQNPDLPNWYRSKGFEVVMVDKPSEHVADISLEIHRTNSDESSTT